MNRTQEQKSKKNRQLWQKSYGIICLLALSVAFLVGIFARYIHKSTTDPGQILADKFYFTANLLGDTCMVKADGSSEDSYAFTEASTEGTWYLYGSGRHELAIGVQNFYDSLRVTAENIVYQTAIQVTDAGGNSISVSEAQMPTVKKGEESEKTYTLETAADGSAVTDTLTLTIPEHTAWAYEDGTTVTLKVISRSPYQKTLTLHFVLYAVDTTLSYEVVDTIGSPYAELILMTNVTNGNQAAGIQPFIQWTEELDIDNTNSLTFTKAADGSFVQMSGMTDRYMKVSQSLATGRSETIYFFKADTSKNYSRSETVVSPDTAGNYIISIGK